MSTVFRVVKNSNYTTLSNYHFKDKKLSWKAKGLLSTILSLPDDWNYTIEGLSKLSADGIKATNSGLLELERYGYLERKQTRNENGHFGLAEYYVYEQPVNNENTMPEEYKERTETPLCQNGQTVENTAFPPSCQKRQTEKRISEKDRQLNTNILNTKELSTYSSSSSLKGCHETVRLMEEEEEAQLKKVLGIQKAEEKYSKELVYAVYREILKRDSSFIQMFNAHIFMKICRAIVETQQRDPIRILPNLINTYLDNIVLGIKATNGIHMPRDSGVHVSAPGQNLCREYDFSALEKELISN